MGIEEYTDYIILGLGVIILAIAVILTVNFISKKNKSKKSMHKIEIESHDAQLNDWVTRARESGMEKEYIRTTLVNNGWNPTQVDNALKDAP